MNNQAILFSSETPDLAGFGVLCEQLERDWFGKSLAEPVGVHFALDETHFHFLACRSRNALIHPEAEPGKFQPKLWKYDVAEFFLSSWDHSEYLEFNLAPNGAWWSCFFEKRRVASRAEPLKGVITSAEMREGSWKAHAKIPRAEIPWLDPRSNLLNAAFILDSPEQRFVTLADLGNGKPDFHRPQDFLPMRLST